MEVGEHKPMGSYVAVSLNRSIPILGTIRRNTRSGSPGRSRRTVVSPKIVLILLLSGLIPPGLVAAAEPESPRVYIDTTSVASTGKTIAISSGGNFQAALAAAQPGDVITLAAGATYRGPFTLPNKPGAGWITVRTSTPDSSLPAPGTRIAPTHAPLMPRLIAASGSVITTAAGAHHYRFIGVEITPAPGNFLYDLVFLGSPDGSEAGLPHDIIFERSYLHGDPVKGTRRGIALNSRTTAVIDSYLADFKEVGADSQAIAGWNGPGPFKIVNNYLEGAGENVLFGGADPSIRDLVPADIEIRGNHFAKPLSWKIGDPAYAGTPWNVKNLFELKNARRVVIAGNLFERSWGHAQVGFAVLFTVRNQSGTAPWSAVQDIEFVSNVVRHSGAGVDILARDATWPSGSEPVRRIAIRNNLFLDIGGPQWKGDGLLFQLLQGPADVTIEHNTAVQTGNIITAEGPPATGFVYRNNITPHNTYGVIGSGYGSGIPTLAQYFPGAVFENNVLAGSPAYRPPYPPKNFSPPSLAAVGFMALVGGDYRLAAGSPYKNGATDGSDIGVDFENPTPFPAGVLPVPLPVGKKPATPTGFSIR